MCQDWQRATRGARPGMISSSVGDLFTCPSSPAEFAWRRAGRLRCNIPSLVGILDTKRRIRHHQGMVPLQHIMTPQKLLGHTKFLQTACHVPSDLVKTSRTNLRYALQPVLWNLWLISTPTHLPGPKASQILSRRSSIIPEYLQRDARLITQSQ